MPPAYWKAVIYYGDDSFGMDRSREKQFVPDEDGHVAAQDWVETVLEQNWKFTVGEVEFIVPHSVINHVKIFFVEETPEEP